MLGAHEQAAGRIDSLKHALAWIGLVFDRDPLPQAESAIEPIRTDSVKCFSSAPERQRLAEPLNQTLEHFAGSHLVSAGLR